MVVGCYSLHLYCEACNKFGDFVSSFYGNYAECKRDAKKSGWLFVGDREAFCSKGCKAKHNGAIA